MIGLIPRPLHAVLDYLWAVVVFFAPQLFGFEKNKKGRQATFAFSAVELAVVLLSKRDKK